MSFPAAIAAALQYPERQVIWVVGDGGALMTYSELATAIMKNIKNLCIIISNNNSYGTIRFHQETHYPGQPYAMDLVIRIFRFGTSFWCSRTGYRQAP